MAFPVRFSSIRLSSYLSGLEGVKCSRSITSISTGIDVKLNFIGGERTTPTTSKSTFPVLEPATGEQLCECPASSSKDVDEAVGLAKRAQPDWAKLSGMERGSVLRKAALLLQDNLEDIARLEVRDSGKPIYEARWDLSGVVDVLNYYAGVAPTLLGEHIPLSNGNFAYTIREPLGVVGGIGAWNYPFQTCSWKCAPALACGNAIVYKPSPLTPYSSVVFAELLTLAGLPPGVISIVQGEGETGEALCVHPGVSKVSFTGSVTTGQRIMASCAKRGLRPVTLELGGKSPLVIFEDANLENAAKGAMLANFLSQGQVCSNAARVYVQRRVYQDFVELVVERVKRMKIGNPLDVDTKVGATVSQQQLDKVLEYVQSVKDEGGKILCGGERVKLADPALANGFYFSPCVVINAGDETRAVREEIFGSLMTIMPFSEEQEVLQRSNDTPFGLSAGIFTKDLQRAHRMASKLQAGSLYINSYNVVTPEVAFGGYKMSGFGRELGQASLTHYTQIKSVYVEMGDTLDSPI